MNPKNARVVVSVGKQQTRNLKGWAAINNKLNKYAAVTPIQEINGCWDCLGVFLRKRSNPERQNQCLESARQTVTTFMLTRLKETKSI